MSKKNPYCMVTSPIIPRGIKIKEYLEKLEEKGYRLLGYDFFIISPGKFTLPDMHFDRSFDDEKMTNKEIMNLALSETSDSEKIVLYFKNLLNEHEDKEGSLEYKQIYTEVLNYLNNKSSQIYIGYEFVHREPVGME